MNRDNRTNKPHPRRARSFSVNGPALRTLRAGRGWTQELAAEKAGLSDRLIRKAEGGGPIEIQSIAILAQLYSTPQRQLTPNDLLAKPIEHLGEKATTDSAVMATEMVRRFFEEVWNHGRLDSICELVSPNCVHHAEGNVYHGHEALRRRVEYMHGAFSGVLIEIEEITAHQDIVICRWRAKFTHTGDFLGVPPTGRCFEALASTWIRFADGQLVEGWDYWDKPLLDIVLQR